MTDSTALIQRQTDFLPALRNAIALWADARTDVTSFRRVDLLRSKQRAVESFFTFIGKHPAEIKPMDVKQWQAHLETTGLKASSIYWWLSSLSSFYSWAMLAPGLQEVIRDNPARLALPKPPRAYQSESAKSLDDDQLRSLVEKVRERASTGDLVGLRDYALLLFYLVTGMRRQEVISLRGRDLDFKEDRLVIRAKTKGGDYAGREIRDPLAKNALIAYLGAANRMSALHTDRPLWTRHDRAGRPGAQLTSRAFVENLQRYAREAGIGHIHLHQTRHTFARMVSEDLGSLHETMDALGHKNISTTRVYVQRIAIRRDKHSERIAARFRSQPSQAK